jgi:MoxR-like ATPase
LPDTTATSDSNLARERLLELETALNGEFLERGQIITTTINSLISKTHSFQLGPPGIAKSALIERAYKRISGIEGRLFRWLLTKFSTPEEIFGPPSLKALEQDEYRRNTHHKLPEAYVAFLDEAFNANSSILNSLLTIMNERLFFNNGGATEVPLNTLFVASNQLPQGDELNALYDRLHFRHLVRPVQDPASFVKMMQLAWVEHPTPVVSWNDIVAAQHAAEKVVVPGDVIEAFKEVRDSLRREGIEPTERRFRESLRIVKTEAFMNDRTEAEIEDLHLLTHVLWHRPEDIKVVQQAVLSLCNPLDREAGDLLEEIEKVARSMDQAISQSDSKKELARASVEFFSKLNKAKGEIKVLEQKYVANGRKTTALEDVKNRFRVTSKRLREECFDFPEVDGNDV